MGAKTTESKLQRKNNAEKLFEKPWKLISWCFICRFTISGVVVLMRRKNCNSVWVKKRFSFFCLFTVADMWQQQRGGMKCWLRWTGIHWMDTWRAHRSADPRRSGCRFHWILLMNYWWCQLQQKFTLAWNWKLNFSLEFLSRATRTKQEISVLC